MLTEAFHGAYFERQKTLKSSDLEAMLYPARPRAQSDAEIVSALTGFFDRYKEARTRGG